MMNSYVGKLESIIQQHIDNAFFAVQVTDARYDDLIIRKDINVDESNDSFLIFHQYLENEILIEAICLYIDSLRVRIPAKNVSEVLIQVIISDVKLFLYAEVMRIQSSMFSRINENTWHLASGLSHKIITQHVVDGALKTIPFSDAVVFRIYDEAQQKLVPVALSGFDENYYSYTVSTGESVSGKVFNSQQAIILNSRSEILSSFVTVSSQREALLQSNPLANALICAPVMDQQQCYGTLTVLSINRHSVFNSLAKSLLETYASQVALAWRNAKIYDQKVATLQEVDTLRRQLVRQNDMLKGNVELYNEMVRIMTKNKGIEQFLDAISVHFHLSFGYFDILGNRHNKSLPIALGWENYFDIIKDKSGEDSYHYAEKYLVIPLRHENENIGLFMMGVESYDEYTTLILARLKDFVIMEIMKQASTLAVNYKKKGQLIHSLLESGDSRQTEKKLLSWGFTLQMWVMCIRVEMSQDIITDIDFLSVANKINALMVRRNAWVYLHNNAVIIILSENYSGRIEEFSEKLEKEVLKNGFRIAGFSNVLLKEKLNVAIEQANIAAEVMLGREREGALRFCHTGIERLFVYHDKKELLSFVEDNLSPVLAEDRKDKQLLLTLMTFIKHSRSITTTAEELAIHPNTLYQRIKKIEKLTHLSLSDADDFLMLSFSCYMFKLYQ